MNRLGLIGFGRIGESFAELLAGDGFEDWQIAGLLTRRRRTIGGIPAHTNPETFLASGYDLIIEAAGPGALADIGADALRHAPLWTVSAVALADDNLRRRLSETATATGHQLRVVLGAIAAVDGLKTVAVDRQARLDIFVEMPADAPGDVPYSGSARAAAGRFPNNVNIAVAAALAGPGLDRTQVHVSRHSGTGPRRIRLVAVNPTLRVESALIPLDATLTPHPVAAALAAALADVAQPLVIA